MPAELTVQELVDRYAGFYPHPRSVEETIELVGLSDKRRARAGKLSGGQLRRLDVALAIVGDPELVFLDEPTTGFDPAARHQAWELVEDLRRLGKTIFLTTHFMDEAEALADRWCEHVQRGVPCAAVIGPAHSDRRQRAWLPLWWRPRGGANRNRFLRIIPTRPARPAEHFNPSASAYPATVRDGYCDPRSASSTTSAPSWRRSARIRGEPYTSSETVYRFDSEAKKDAAFLRNTRSNRRSAISFRSR
jgi:energy-coupling factor transporter ATP-binding protein EcfA2